MPVDIQSVVFADMLELVADTLEMVADTLELVADTRAALDTAEHIVDNQLAGLGILAAPNNSDTPGPLGYDMVTPHREILHNLLHS